MGTLTRTQGADHKPAGLTRTLLRPAGFRRRAARGAMAGQAGGQADTDNRALARDQTIAEHPRRRREQR